MSNSRPRLLVLNQYYWPGVEATAHLLTELCEGLASEYDVTVVTGRLRGHEDEAPVEVRNGVTIVRVGSTTFDRASLGLRASNYFSYLGLAIVHALRTPRPDIVLCMTDPPMVGDIGLFVARRFRAPLVVVSEDVFPEIAVELHRLRNPLLVNLLKAMQYRGVVAACGLAGSASLDGTVFPFILRGVRLIGIDSVYQPAERRPAVWDRLATDLDPALLERMVTRMPLADVPKLAPDFLRGAVRGRLVVDTHG